MFEKHHKWKKSQLLYKITVWYTVLQMKDITGELFKLRVSLSNFRPRLETSSTKFVFKVIQSQWMEFNLKVNFLTISTCICWIKKDTFLNNCQKPLHSPWVKFFAIFVILDMSIILKSIGGLYPPCEKYLTRFLQY